MLKSKIHQAKVTAASVEYEGSITIDSGLMEAVGIIKHEQVHVLDIDNGERLVTYALPGDAGEICINGAAARKVSVGDRIIILSYADVDEVEVKHFKPWKVKLDANNQITRLIDDKTSGSDAQVLRESC